MQTVLVTILKTPFSNHSSERQFMCDYYGGGYFDCANIYTEDFDCEDIRKAVKMLVRNKNTNSGSATVVWEVREEADNDKDN